MSLKLGEMLVQEGAITRKQLDEALKCQVIFGGRLGTNLVEMGFLDEQKLVECLSHQLETPYVTAEQLMSIPPQVINLISVDLAREYKIVPISLDKKKLSVAIWDPSDLSALDAISFITGFIIKPLVCSELRLLLALEQYYGIKREVRYIQMKGGTGSRSRETDRAVPAGASSVTGNMDDSPFKDLMDELPPPPTQGAEENQSSWGDLTGIQPQETDSGPLLGQGTSAAHQAGLAGQEPATLDLERPLTPPPQTRPVSPPPPPPSSSVAPAPPPALPVPPPAVIERDTSSTAAPPGNLLAALAAAADRDAIADALVGYLGQEFERVALFMIKGRIGAGWRGVQNGATIPGFDHFQVPLDEPTLLKLAVDTKNFYLGPVLDTSGNAQIIKGLGGGSPDTVLLIPIIMMERVVTVFYVDGDKTLLGKKLFELQKIIGKAALAFEILILKNKIMLA
jgi:MshEN domain